MNMISEKEIKTIDLKDIQPSQLYLSSDRLEKMKNMDQELKPLPVREIDNKLFFTDGHHRAYTLFEEGREKIKVYIDEDDMDWLEYLICVDWCEKEGLESISDLEDRIVNEERFKKKWVDRCQKMHEKVKEDKFEYCVKVDEETDPDLKSDICEMVLRTLPEYFEIEEAIEEYIKGVREKYFLSANVGDIPIGFLAMKDHNEFTSELYVIGILEELQGRGIGERLVERAEEHLSSKDKKYLTVKALGSSRPDDEPYGKTRAFYRSVGFIPLEEFTNLWDKENPCLIMVKSLD